METKLIKDFVEDYYKYDLVKDEKGKPTGDIERFVDYDEVFPKKSIGEIMASDNPREKFYEVIDDWNIEYDYWYYQEDFWKKFSEFCKENNLDEDEARDVVFENYHWTYPDSFLNPDVNIVIQLDTGDGNYDFTLHNIINYAKDYGYCHGLEEEAALHWLAKQQKRLSLLKKNIKKSDCYSNGNCEESKFVSSAITELVNLPSHMASVVFLVSMPLQDAINLKEELVSIRDKFDQYNPLTTKGSPFGSITLDKNVSCGLFDCWSGGGSLLKIELERDVKIPLHLINNIWSDYKNPYGYTIDDVYGLSSECWKESYKGLKLRKEVAA